MKFLYLSLFFITIVFGGQLQITADRFDRDQQKKISSFEGHVKIRQATDELNASKVLVYVDDENHPIKYEAIGDVSFSIKSEDNATYVGRAQKMLFFPLKKEYQFFTKVFLKETNTLRTLSGDKIVINTQTGNAQIVGKKKAPVRVTFEIENDKESPKGINNSIKSVEMNQTVTPDADSNSTMTPLDNNQTQK